jgi:hydroxyacylglutathione hydrolase
MLHLHLFTFNDFAENTYLLYADNGECLVIDPGCYYKEEQAELVNFIATKKLAVTHVLNTHCHVDHVLGNYFVTDYYKVPLHIPAGEDAVLKSVKVYAPTYGFNQYQESEPHGFLSEQTSLALDDVVIRILSVPGHSPGHVAFYLEAQKILIGGDVLFRASIGRTDLPGGNLGTLLNSINTKLFSLPDDVVVYPGHGPETTIGYEKLNNPYCGIHLKQ